MIKVTRNLILKNSKNYSCSTSQIVVFVFSFLATLVGYSYITNFIFFKKLPEIL